MGKVIVVGIGPGGYEDITIDLNAGRATTTTGRRLSLAYCVAPRVVVLADALVSPPVPL